MLDLLWKRHSQAGLRMLFHNTYPLGGQAQPRIFSQQFLREAKALGHLSSIMSDGVPESRASSLAKGFESTAPAWLAQAQPCASQPIRVNPSHLTRSFPLPRPSGQPSVALSRTCPRARLWFQKMILPSMILPDRKVESPASRTF